VDDNIMDDNIWKILIGALGVIAGAVITALASAYTANQKIKELELTYEQKLRDNYLANARQYSESVYVPLSIALLKLLDAFLKYRDSIKINQKEQTEIKREKFCRTYKDYMARISNLFERGADAYITSELEQPLQSFNRFLDASFNTEQVVYAMTLEYQVRIPGVIHSHGKGTLKSDKGKLAHAYGMLLGRTRLSFWFMGTGFTQVPELLAAPIDSHEFEGRILSDVSSFKSLIKEVTLGSHSRQT
jgi:hypothetical protein